MRANIKIFSLIKILVIVLTLASFGCSGGNTVQLIISEITGQGALDENQVADYSVTVSNGSELTYAWTVEPSSAGAITNGDTSSCNSRAIRFLSSSCALVMS